MTACRVKGLVIGVMALMVSISPANGQEPAPTPAAGTETSGPIEVTPFVSIGSLGSWPIGAAISFPVGAKVSLETEVGYRRGEGNINALSLSGNVLYALPRLGRATPYLAAGAGLGEYGAPIVHGVPGVAGPSAEIGTERRVAFMVNAGGGIKVPVDDTWGMRTDARWFKSLGRHGSEQWRVSHGVSFDVRKR